MAETDRDPIDGLVEQFLRYMQDRRQGPPSLEGLTGAERAEASAVLRLLEACWGSGSLKVPALEEDPLAVELGLVAKPASLVEVRGHAVKAARMQRGLNIQHVADRLGRAGHKVDIAWVFDLEQAAAREMPSELAEALGEVLGTRAADLTAAPQVSVMRSSLEMFLSSQAFRERVQRWSRIRGVDSTQATAKFSSMMRHAAARTKGTPDEEEWVRLLDALMETHES